MEANCTLLRRLCLISTMASPFTEICRFRSIVGYSAKEQESAKPTGTLTFQWDGVSSETVYINPKNGSRGRIFLTQRRREAENAEKIANL